MNFLFNRRKIKPPSRCLITLSTCWYVLKSKFNVNTYVKWIQNFLSIVNNFNLVIYTNYESISYLLPLIDKKNDKIKVIIKPIEEFYTYKYKDYWIKNHESSNMDLHRETDWKLNMLWNEKVFFVNETIQQKYFTTLYYGWCDIGYFRNRTNDFNTSRLQNWPNPEKLLTDTFNNVKIHYGCVQEDPITYYKLLNDITSHYLNTLKSPPTVQYHEICFAGGFFCLKENHAKIYAKIYDEKLMYYFSRNYVIKDDQTIVMDVILSNQNMFYIHMESETKYDKWFMFQRLML